MNNRVFYLDDDPEMLAFVKRLDLSHVEKNASILVETEKDPAQALWAVANRGPFAVILSDMNMPGMNGIQFLSAVKRICPESIRMMLTGNTTLNVAIDAVNEGNIFRFLTKPVRLEVLANALATGIEQYRLIHAEKELLEKTLAGSVKALTEILSLADPIAFGSATRVRRLVQKLASAIKVANPWEFEVAAMLSQVAFISVPDAILQSVFRGEDLAIEDLRTFEAHPQLGQRLVANIPRMEGVAEAIAYQEKRFDGSGPPASGLAGRDIPLAARVLKVALDFDKLEMKGLSNSEAIDLLEKRTGWYDPVILEALRGMLNVESTMVLRDVTIRELREKLVLLEQSESKGSSKWQDIIGQIVLAENVWLPNRQLALCKGYEVNPVVLRRLVDFATRKLIPEKIPMWVTPKKSERP